MWKKRGEIAAVILIVVLAIAITGFAIFYANRSIALPYAGIEAPPGGGSNGPYAPPITPPNNEGQDSVPCKMWKNNGQEAAQVIEIEEWFEYKRYCAGHCGLIGNFCIPRRADADGGWNPNGQFVGCNCENCG